MPEEPPEPPVEVPAKSWGDEQADRMAAVEQRMSDHLKNSNGASFEQDETGLAKAYQDPTGINYDPATRTEYIRGSATIKDGYDDLTKIPFWRNL